MRSQLISAVTLATCLAAAPIQGALAQDGAPRDPPTIAVHFPKGATSTTLSGTVKGYGAKTYSLSANAGQTLTMTLTAKNTSLYANIMKPSGEALFNGSMEGPSFSGKLPEAGTYQVVVYFMRNEARRGTSTPFNLNLSIK